MDYLYCPLCGSRLSKRQFDDDWDVPFCESCGKPWFPMFPSAVCVLCERADGKVLFVRQPRIPGLSLITGFIQPGETAEQAAVRETAEETGLHLTDLHPLGTCWYPPDGVLMYLIKGRVEDAPPLQSEELTEAGFLPVLEGLEQVDGSSVAVLKTLRLCLS